MFSINDDEALQLRNHERRVVEYVESVLLNSSVQIMAMQVLCTAPDCVPIETFVLVLFPKDNKESDKKLIDSQVEFTEATNGSSIQFKILKPISEVTKGDVEASLPFSLRGDSLTATGRLIRNDLFTQLEKRFASEENPQSRQWMVRFLQESLQQYVDNGCQRPDDWNEEESNLPFHGKGVTSNKAIESKIAPLGNITFRRPVDDDSDKIITGTSSIQSTQRSSAGSSVHSVVRQRQQAKAIRSLQSEGGSNSLTQLSQREHAPGIRRPGCPCCDPDNAASIMDRLLLQM